VSRPLRRPRRRFCWAVKGEAVNGHRVRRGRAPFQTRGFFISEGGKGGGGSSGGADRDQFIVEWVRLGTEGEGVIMDFGASFRRSNGVGCLNLRGTVSHLQMLRGGEISEKLQDLGLTEKRCILL